MELQGSVTLPASPERVWQALNDAEILRQCIPGCEEVQQLSAEELHARVLLRMGPVRARFAGKVRMTDIKPLQGYTLNFEGSGGSAGFARGSSVITLTPVGEGTRLDYTAHASVAGKLGQIGGRLIDASSRQLADNFFATFRTVLTEGNPTPASAPEAAASQTNEAPRPVLPAGAAASSPSLNHEIPRLVWFFAGVLATSVGVWMGAHWLA